MPDERWSRKEALVIVNSAAHNAPGRKRLKAAGEWLRDDGWTVDWAETARPGDATGMAARAAERRLPVVLVCGGDGTLNEAVNGLAGSETAVSVIPAGTVNLWAREAGLMKPPVEAVRLAARGVRRRVDLGRAGARYFLLMAGFGIDAAVAQRVSHGAKGRLGAAAYALAALRQAMSYRGSRIEIRMDGENRTVIALMVLASNIRNYAGLAKITSNAVIDDGLLDVCIYEGRGRWDIVRLAALTLIRRHAGSGKVTIHRVKRLEIASERPLPVQLDGDAIADSPTEVTVVPGALLVMTPWALKSPLFSRPPE
jgi:YegS/Rv2252/BmrU family lipid kinase